MKHRFIPISATLIGTVAVLSLCTPAPVLAQHGGSTTSDTLQARPLRFLMVRIAQDVGRINDGIWHEDFEMIRDGARGVADHPRVTPEEVAAIKAALGERFEAFVAFDRLVHDTAVEIAEVAEVRDMSLVLGKFATLQQGCVSCHATFRDEVRKALY